VLGDPIAHSLSPAMHNAALAGLGLDAVYVALRVPPQALAATLDLFTTLGVAGNLTVPLKETGCGLVTRPSALAARLGAVNTFWVEDGALCGDNTDVAGLDEILSGLDAPGPWLVAGTGGSARAVAAVAGERRVALLVRSRDAARAAAFCGWARERIPGLDVGVDDGARPGTVINATPAGLVPVDVHPLPRERIAGARVALDLVYLPGATPWVRACRAAGMRAADGRDLLVAQGAHAFERFFPGRRAPREIMRAAVERALRE
jgi:shikimate dehydrogenase